MVAEEKIQDALRALVSPQAVVATGDRAVALGGSADGAVIITGDVRIELNAHQRADLERLLAARLHNVPPLPDHYIPREEYLEPLRRALMGDSAATLGIVGVKGMGGIGKSVLAAALARDLQIQAAFPDGIIWLPIGREPNLPARQEELYLILTGQRENFKDAHQGRLFLSTALREKACLVVLDDVWDARQVEEAFPLRASPRTRYLLTTRNADVLQTLGVQPFPLDVLTPEQALRLLADWAGQPVEILPPEAREVAKECGYLPLAVAMVGAFVRQNPESWARALHRLRTADLEKLRRLFPGYEHPTLLAALDVSVQALPEKARARYLDLAVFPEEAAIPISVLRAFWAPLGLDEDDVADLAETFVSRSLARWDESGLLRLHDLQYDYLRAVVGERLPALHRRFLLACAWHYLGASGETLEGLPWHRLPSDVPYLWNQLVHHLLEAGEWEALYPLLTDFDYLEARCRATSVFDLEADYRLALARWPQTDPERKGVLAAFEERLRLEEYHIAPSPEYLFPALYNHLTWLDAPDGPLHRLCERAREGRRNWLRSVRDPRVQSPSWRRSLEGHTGPINAVAVSPDGGFIISGSDDHTVKVWDTESGRLLYSLEGHTDRVRAVAVSPKGDFIVSGSFDGTLKVWEAESCRLLRSLEEHTWLVHAVAVSPDGRFIVSGSEDCTVKIWDTKSGRLLRSLEGHKRAIWAVAVSPDGKFIVSGSDDCTVKVWETESGRLIRSLERHTGPVQAVAVSSDGRFIISGSRDRTVKVWDAQNGSLLRSLEGHKGRVWAVAVSQDGRLIASGSADHTVKVWETETGHLLYSLEGHSDRVRAVAISPDARFIVSGSEDRTVKVWDAKSGSLIRSLEGSTQFAEAGKSNNSLGSPERHIKPVTAIAASLDGRFIVSKSSEGTVKVWEATTGRLLHTLQGHADKVWTVAVSPNGHLVASGSRDRTVKVWQTENGRLLHSLEGHRDKVWSVAISPDGRFVISGSEDRTVKIWDVENGRLLRSLEEHAAGVNAVAISPDGRFIVSGSRDRTVKVWNFKNGHLLHSLKGHTGRVWAVAVSKDGHLIVSGSADRTVKVWDVESGRLLHSLEGHTAWVNAIAISPDGRWVISGSADRTLRAWDLETDRSHLLFWNDAAILSLVLLPDGRILACGDAAGRVWIFEWVR